MINGDAYVSLQWSGDALYTMEEADNLDYFVPKIGGNIWFDGWVIPKNAPNYENALKFIDFLNRPEVAMANAMYIGYTSAVSPEVLQNSQAAMNVLVENEYEAAEYFGDLNRYPVIDDAKYGVMKDFGEYNDDAIAMWERVKKTRSDVDPVGGHSGSRRGGDRRRHLLYRQKERQRPQSRKGNAFGLCRAVCGQGR